MASGSVLVRYKRSVDSTWKTAHPLLRIDTVHNEADGPTALVDAFAGTIFDLTPGTSYDIELTHLESGQSAKASTIQRGWNALSAKIPTRSFCGSGLVAWATAATRGSPPCDRFRRRARP